jgi:hypothetical protein
VYCLDAATGEVVWEFAPTPAQYILGSPSFADGMVFAPSDNGHLYALTDASGGALNVTVDQPSRISDAADTRVIITVAANFGAATNITVEVGFMARNVTPESPMPFSHSGLSYTWKFGTIPFGSSREIRVVVKGLCVPPPLPPGSGPITGCGTTGAVGHISLTSADFQGHLLPFAYYLFTVENWATTGPPLVASAIPFLAVGVLVALAILAVIVIWRRRRGP